MNSPRSSGFGLWGLIILGAATVVILSGCTPPADNTPSPGPQAVNSPSLTNPPKLADDSGQTATTPSTPQQSAPPPPNTPPKKPTASLDNANRIYQLRDLRTTVIDAPKHKLRLWVMDDDGKRQEGMMWLTDKDVAPDQGMLFVFSVPDDGGFWMQNTLIPLDIIYLDQNGKVLNIAEGQPRDEKNLPSHGAHLDVIELKQGQAKKFGIVPGTVIHIPQSMKM
jgi:hypothetical protein